MGKSKNIVVLSSDDEDKCRSLPSKRSIYSNSGSRSSASRTNPRAPKKARISDSRSRSRLRNQSSHVDEFRWFCEDFDDELTGFKVSSGRCQSNEKELWVDKYKPRSLEELAIHKKKVEEVKAWFEERLRTSREELCNHVLVITGQTGVGKSATIHAIASHLGALLYEWSTPTPTIWHEHLHNSNSGIQYTSKLEEFENFIERIRKYGLIPSSLTGGSKSRVILLIDDLPMTNGKAASGRLHNCLHLLARSTRTPTVIVITDYGKVDSGDNTARFWDELQLSLENVGACKVTFNPITVNSIKKTLDRISRIEQCNMTAEQIDLIAKSSGGDIRHAITSLQFFCLKPKPLPSLSPSRRIDSDKKLDNFNSVEDGFALPFGRDETLSLFHALGKFLHNKREADNTNLSSHDGFLLSEKFSRLPLKMDAPEKILCQAHGQARPISDFLHENVIDFISEEAIDDAWAVVSYLSDADYLLASLRGLGSRSYEAESLLQSAAASVATRGVLFANSHPLSSRWHAIRRPKLWQVEQSSLRNKYELLRQKWVGESNGLRSSDVSVIATEYMPVLKWLGDRATGDFDGNQVNDTEDYNSDTMSLDVEENTIPSDDEIEDW